MSHMDAFHFFIKWSIFFSRPRFANINVIVERNWLSRARAIS